MKPGAACSPGCFGDGSGGAGPGEPALPAGGGLRGGGVPGGRGGALLRPAAAAADALEGKGVGERHRRGLLADGGGVGAGVYRGADRGRGGGLRGRGHAPGRLALFPAAQPGGAAVGGAHRRRLRENMVDFYLPVAFPSKGPKNFLEICKKTLPFSGKMVYNN